MAETLVVPRDVVELSDQSPDDGEEVLIAWLTPLRPTSVDRVPDRDPLPFTLVAHVAGTENEQEGTAAPVLSVHTLTAKAAGGKMGLKNATRDTHRRMLYLGKSCPTVVLTDGTRVGVDYVDVVESPLYVPYGDDQILRKVGRYEVGLTYNPD